MDYPTVYVVLHCNYGDQGVDFHGVFSSQEKAEEFIVRREPDKDKRQWWDIVETEIEE